MRKKVLISSTGGHWTQLNQIYKMCRDKKQIQLITEKNATTQKRNDILFLIQQDRKHIIFPFVFFVNVILSFFYAIMCHPKIVVSTGAGVVIPFLLFSKMLGSRIIFIESFAKIDSPTITGKFVYKFSDEFFIQWPELKTYYPKAIYKGSLY
jgi:UDP-N-acetylglucosamine:LPS N-acetylglucosamine transferase